MRMRNYEDLVAWQKAMQLATMVYLLQKGLPKEEIYGIGDQIRRAVVSVPSNIAEGFGRGSDAEFNRFLSISRGSLFEAMMIGAIPQCEQQAMESSTDISNDDVEMAALVVTLLNYTVFETLDTIGMYKFGMNDVNKIKKAYMNPMQEGIGIMSLGRCKKGLKKVRINTRKMKKKKRDSILKSASNKIFGKK